MSSPSDTLAELAAALKLDAIAGRPRLEAILPALTELQSDIQRAEVRASLARDRTALLMVQADEIIGQLRTRATTLSQALDDAKQALAGAKTKSGALAAQQFLDKMKLAVDKAQIANIRDHQEKLRRWFWVPGYGAYLAGQNLADALGGALSDAKRAEEELDGLEQQIAAEGQELNDLKTKIAGLEATISNTKTQLDAATSHSQALGAEKKVWANQTVIAADADQFYTQLFAAVANLQPATLDQDWGSLQLLALGLDAKVRFHDQTGSSSNIPLQEAMAHFAQDTRDLAEVSVDSVHYVEFRADEDELWSLTQSAPDAWTLTNDSQQQQLGVYSIASVVGSTLHLYSGEALYPWVTIELDNHVVQMKRNPPPRPNDPTIKPGSRQDLNAALQEAGRIASYQRKFPIGNTSSVVSGWLVNEVATSSKGTVFTEMSNGLWGEIHNSVPFARFNETGRDIWSVYLADPGRPGVTLRLDLWLRQVIYADADKGPVPICDITDAVFAKTASSK